ncbi:M20/M25/M40 family metallo-hydrolase [bacterium]|nr:MAG: M20/M25/M40 family metallo-hydrolase [bacterium]
MILPFEAEMQFTTMNWMPGTQGKQRGKALLAPTTVEEAVAMKDQMKGAWIVMPANWTMRGPAGAAAADEAARKKEAEVKAAIDAAGILGRIYGAKDERLHSSGTWRDKTYETHPKGSENVMIVVRKSDHDRVLRNIEYKRPVELEFEAENRFIKGELPQYNVIAEIPGTEKPNEVVIVCGHLDSWNSPGSQGTCDNGTGSVNTIESARILMASGVKPKRTIRFILWSGEEQGLLGSRAYVEKHKGEMDGISAVLNDDGGTNYQGGYVGIASMKPMLEAAFAPTVAAFPTLPMQFDTVEKMPLGGSSDHAPFNGEGVPGFFTKESGRADYGKVWHTQFDKYDEAIPEYLVQSSTNHAVVAFYLAQAPTLLPRAPKPEKPARAADIPKAIAMGSDQITYPWIMLFDEHDASQPHDHEDDWTLEVIDRLKRTAKGLFGTMFAR